MRASDYLKDTLSSFRKQRLRTALTALGIAIGAFAITLMIGLGQGLQNYIEQQFLAFHDDRVLLVFPSLGRQGGRLLDRITQIGQPARRISEDDEQRRQGRRGGVWISEEQIAALRALPGVELVAPMTTFQVDGIALVDADTSHVGFYGTDFASLVTNPFVGTPSAGVLPVDEDSTQILLAPQYAQSFGLEPQQLIGRQVEIRVPKLGSVMQRFQFRDPGTFEDERKIFRATIVGLAERSAISRAVFPSLALGRSMARYQSGNPDYLSENTLGSQVHVRLTPDADQAGVRRSIAALDLMARSLDDQLQQVNQVFLVVDIVLSFFGALSLLVATLGIANTLLMAITERTREIGVMKALGATSGTIRWMFAIEAAGIGLIGGLSGTGGAVVLGLVGDFFAKRYVAAAAALEGYSVFAYPWWLLFGAPAFSCLIGVLAGLYPASRAARLHPIDALRSE